MQNKTKILFVAENSGVDYMTDCLLHGLYALLPVQVYLTSDLWYMFEGNNIDALSALYGKGFSVTNRIPADKKAVHDEKTVKENIKNHFYDVVIFGSVFRCLDYLDDVLKVYKKNEIIFVDGEDYDLSTAWELKRVIRGNLSFIKKCYAISVEIFKKYEKRRRKSAIDLAKKGIYFKRELCDRDCEYMYPVSFAISEEDVVKSVPDKERDMAFIVPGDKSTYIYDNERDYYDGYKIARRGKTTKKMGWDCMRHYEILANGCIPYFPNIQNCPTYTMANFPKNIIIETNRLFDEGKMTEGAYKYFAEYLLDYTRRYLTTKELAKYVLSKTDITI